MIRMPGFPAILLFLSLGVYSNEATIVIRNYSKIDRNYITLGDIAVIDGIKDNSTVKLLESSILDKSVTMGNTYFVTKQDVIRHLRKKFFNISSTLNVNGNAYIRVDLVGRSLQRSSYENEAKKCLDSWLAKKYTKYTVEPEEHLREIVVPEGQIKIVTKQCEFVLGERIVVIADVYVNGKRYQSLPIDFNVYVYENVLVAKESKSALDRIDLYSFKKEERNIAAIRGQVVSLDKGISNSFRLSRKLYAGQVLTEDMIEPVPDVTKGSSVTVIAQVGKISIVREALAVEDGNVLDKIKIENSVSGNQYVARVIGKNRVIVE